MCVCVFVCGVKQSENNSTFCTVLPGQFFLDLIFFALLFCMLGCALVCFNPTFIFVCVCVCVYFWLCMSVFFALCVRFYIGCDFCDQWYHGECVNMTPKQAKAIDNYRCAACLAKAAAQQQQQQAATTTAAAKKKIKGKQQAKKTSVVTAASQSAPLPTAVMTTTGLAATATQSAAVVTAMSSSRKRKRAAVAARESDSDTEPQGKRSVSVLDASRKRRGRQPQQEQQQHEEEQGDGTGMEMHVVESSPLQLHSGTFAVVGQLSTSSVVAGTKSLSSSSSCTLPSPVSGKLPTRGRPRKSQQQTPVARVDDVPVSESVLLAGASLQEVHATDMDQSLDRDALSATSGAALVTSAERSVADDSKQEDYRSGAIGAARSRSPIGATGTATSPVAGQRQSGRARKANSRYSTPVPASAAAVALSSSSPQHTQPSVSVSVSANSARSEPSPGETVALTKSPATSPSPGVGRRGRGRGRPPLRSAIPSPLSSPTAPQQENTTSSATTPGVLSASALASPMDIGSSSSLSVPLQASLSDDVFATQAGDDLAKDETGSASLSATSTSKLSSGPPLREDSTPAVASKASLSTGSRRGARSRRSKVSPRSPVRDSQQEQVAMSVPFTSASSDDVSITTTPAETAMDTTSAAVSNDVNDEVAASASPRFSRIRRGRTASPASSQAVAVTVKSDTAEEPRRGLAHASNTATATAATASRGRRSRGRAKTPDVASAETPHAMGVELESSPAVDPSPAAVSVDAAPATGAAVNDDERASTDMTTTGAASVEVDAVNDQVVPEDISVLCNVCKEVVSAHR